MHDLADDCSADWLTLAQLARGTRRLLARRLVEPTKRVELSTTPSRMLHTRDHDGAEPQALTYYELAGWEDSRPLCSSCSAKAGMIDHGASVAELAALVNTLALVERLEWRDLTRVDEMLEAQEFVGHLKLQQLANRHSDISNEVLDDLARTLVTTWARTCATDEARSALIEYAEYHLYLPADQLPRGGTMVIDTRSVDVSEWVAHQAFFDVFTKVSGHHKAIVEMPSVVLAYLAKKMTVRRAEYITLEPLDTPEVIDTALALWGDGYENAAAALAAARQL